MQFLAVEYKTGCIFFTGLSSSFTILLQQQGVDPGRQKKCFLWQGPKVLLDQEEKMTRGNRFLTFIINNCGSKDTDCT